MRAQQFVAFTRHDLELRKAKAAALQRQLYPDTTKRLAREEFEAFFERLMADTARRAQHRHARCARAAPWRSARHRAAPALARILYSLSGLAVGKLVPPGCCLPCPLRSCRDELAEEARAEALAKLKSTAPPPLNHQRQQRAASPAPAAQPTSGDS